jgi:hypothetical protein
LNGLPDDIAQVIQWAAVNTGNIIQRMVGLARAAYAQHPEPDEGIYHAGVMLQQFLDGHFRINLYHDRMIASSMPEVFALAQR